MTVPLCPTCHTNIHREAAALHKGNNEKTYINSDNYPDDTAEEKALFLAKYIVESKLRFEATGEEKAEGARHMMQVSFSREQLALAHDVKRMLGFRSLERATIYLFEEAWKNLKKSGK